MRQEINKLNEEQKDDKTRHLPYCRAVIMETLRYIPQVRRLTNTIFETGAHRVPSRSQKQTILVSGSH